MKKALIFLIGLIAVASLGLILGFLTGFIKPKSDIQAVDSVMIDQRVTDAMNPSFTSVEELKVFQQKCIEDYSLDSAFRAMPQQTLATVAGVILNKTGHVCKKSVVDEFRRCSDVYNNLPTTSESEPTKELSAMEAQRLPVDTTLIRSESDTMINGEQVQLIRYRRR